MAKKTTKKVNVKDEMKKMVKTAIQENLKNLGNFTEGKEYGFTKDTLVLSLEECDVQIKLITPKTGITRYEIEEDVE